MVLLRRYIKRICGLLIFFTAVQSHAQGGFERHYVLDSSDYSICMDAIEAPSGDYILAGYTLDSIGSFRITVMGINPTGNQLWRKDYGGSHFPYASNPFISRMIYYEHDAFYILSTTVDSSNKNSSVLMKFNYSGDTIWQKKFSHPQGIVVQGVSRGLDSTLLLTGWTTATSAEHLLLLKTDKFGNQIWRKEIQRNGNPKVIWGYRALQDSLTRRIIAVGHQYQPDNTNENFSPYGIVLVCDSLGNELSKYEHPGSCGSTFSDLIQTKDKHFVAVGRVDQCNNFGGPMGARRWKGVAFRFDITGSNTVAPIWEKQFDTLSSTNYIATVVEQGTNLLFGGALDTTLYRFNDYWITTRLIKTDKDGQIIWRRLYIRNAVNTESKWPTSLNLSSGKGFIIPFTMAYKSLPRAFSIMKLDSTGCDTTELACKIAWTVGIKDYKKERLSIFPNPANENFEISFNGEFAEDVHLTVVDITGKTVYAQYLGTFSKAKVNTAQIPPGYYFVSLITKTKNTVTVPLVIAR